MNRLEWTEENLKDLHQRYIKLLKFVKECAYLHLSNEQLKHYNSAAGMEIDDIEHARDLLEEVGEL